LSGFKQCFLWFWLSLSDQWLFTVASH